MSGRDGLFALDLELFSDEALFRALYARQRPERRERIDRMRHLEGKYQLLGAGYLMEYALEKAGMAGAEILYGPNGKPCPNGGCYLNLSHSGMLAVCALSDREVGVDAEKLRTLPEALVKRVFTERERAHFAPEEYLRLWTARESVMKWTGAGMTLPPSSIEIIPDRGPADRVEIRDGRFRQEAGKLRISRYTAGPYVISVCSEKDPFPAALQFADPTKEI